MTSRISVLCSLVVVITGLVGCVSEPVMVSHGGGPRYRLVLETVGVGDRQLGREVLRGIRREMARIGAVEDETKARYVVVVDYSTPVNGRSRLSSLVHLEADVRILRGSDGRVLAERLFWDVADVSIAPNLELRRKSGKLGREAGAWIAGAVNDREAAAGVD